MSAPDSSSKSVTAWVCPAPKEKLKKEIIQLPELQPDEVQIKVLYCGICHSDIHLADGDWGGDFPRVVGHEIVGSITKVGSQVNHLKVGQIVGVGWQRSCCKNCEYCRMGKAQCCENSESTCSGGGVGGFAEYHQTKADFAIPIPEGLSLAHASCLMCAGVTTFTPYVDYDIKPYHKVAIVGIGGLGHLAIKWGVNWGCEVTAFSTSPDKEKQAKSLGAHNFVVYSSEKQEINPEFKEKFNKYFDFILVTIPFAISTKMLYSCLKKYGKICYVASGGGEINLTPADLFIGGPRSVVGSVIGSISNLHLMLEFATRHNILPEIEVFPMDKVNEAMEKVKDNKVRFRAVLKVSE